MSKKGFFTSTTTALKPVKISGDSCFLCGLYKGCNSPKMLATGHGDKGLLVIAEAPGKTEDEQGTQLVGEAGQLLRRKLCNYGIDLDKDCVKINSVNCRPPKNRTPTDKEVEYCRPRVWDVINEVRPKVILLLGGPALESFLGHRWKDPLGGITSWRGFTIPDRETGAWVIPTYHPSYVNRSSKQPVVELIFEQDIKKAIDMLEVPFSVYEDETKQVQIIHEEKEIVGVISNMFYSYDKTQLVAFDYETTGLKPQKEGHRIVCMSICYKDDVAFSFMLPDKESQAFRYIKRFLQDKSIKKTGHNIKFEDTWTLEILGFPVKGWEWCSMQAAHIQDNRPGIVGLKLQTYLNFGVMGYDDIIGPYLKGRNKKDGANGFNNIDKAPKDELLLYCGKDSLFQWRLAMKQMECVR